MDLPLSKSQKRNKRRTNAKNNKKEKTSKHKYSVGDCVLIDSHDYTWDCKDNNWQYKGFIVKVNYTIGLPTSYIIRTQLPISFESAYNRVYDYEPANGNCIFSRKRYGDKFDSIVSYVANCREVDAEIASRRLQDYTEVYANSIRRCFPISKYRPTIRECLYHFWFVEQATAIGRVSMLNDIEVKKKYMKGNFRWNWDNRDPDTLSVVELKTEKWSNKVHYNARASLIYSPLFQQQADSLYPLLNGFETIQLTTSDSYYIEKDLNNNLVIMQFYTYRDNYDVSISEIQYWRVISQELYDLYMCISLTRDNFSVKRPPTVLDEYLDMEYKQLPDEIKKFCNHLMWPRDKIYEVRKNPDRYSLYSREIVEIDNCTS